MKFFEKTTKRISKVINNPALLLKKIFLLKNNMRVLRLKNIHRDKTAVLIGNGPSVKFEDLNKFNNFVTFACNRFYLCYKDTDFRPNYTICADPQMMKDYGEDIEEKACGTVFFCGAIYQKPKKINTLHLKTSREAPWFNKPTKGLNTSGATLIIALQLAYYMGIKKIILYGVDHNFKFQENVNKTSIWDSAIGDNNHFIPNYRGNKPWCPPATQEIERGFKECAQYLADKGGFVLNASRQSSLPFVKKVPFEFIQNQHLN